MKSHERTPHERATSFWAGFHGLTPDPSHLARLLHMFLVPRGLGRPCRRLTVDNANVNSPHHFDFCLGSPSFCPFTLRKLGEALPFRRSELSNQGLFDFHISPQKPSAGQACMASQQQQERAAVKLYNRFQFIV